MFQQFPSIDLTPVDGKCLNCLYRVYNCPKDIPSKNKALIAQKQEDIWVYKITAKCEVAGLIGLVPVSASPPDWQVDCEVDTLIDQVC